MQTPIEWLGRDPTAGVIFLDVQLVDGLPFGIFETTPVDAPVVFVTAHDGFAMPAFDVARSVKDLVIRSSPPTEAALR